MRKEEILKDFLCEAVGSPGLPKYWQLLDSAKQNLFALKSKDSLRKVFYDRTDLQSVI